MAYYSTSQTSLSTAMSNISTAKEKEEDPEIIIVNDYPKFILDFIDIGNISTKADFDQQVLLEKEDDAYEIIDLTGAPTEEDLPKIDNKPEIIDLTDSPIKNADVLPCGEQPPNTQQSIFRNALPVMEKRKIIMDSINENQVIIITGETGSGKSTRIPQFCVEEGYTKKNQIIGITQPRVISAIRLAERVADEMKERRVGDKVGFSVRHNNNTGPHTIIKFMTDGILLTERVHDPMLSQYSVIMIDEAHERTLTTDVLLPLLKEILKTRTDLKLIICSATLDTELFSNYFNKAPIVQIPGRSYEVKEFFRDAKEAKEKPYKSFAELASDKVIEINKSNQNGDILIFMDGQESIETTIEVLKWLQDNQHMLKITDFGQPLELIPLYASLSEREMSKAFVESRSDIRKVVVATNVAEASLTIDDKERY